MGLPLVVLPACPLRQQASRCPAGTSWPVPWPLWGDRVGQSCQQGRDGVAQPATRWGGNGKQLPCPLLFLCFQLAVESGAEREEGVEAVLSAVQWSSSQPMLELSLLGEQLLPPLCFRA